MSGEAGKIKKLQEKMTSSKKKHKRGARGKGSFAKHQAAHSEAYGESSAAKRDRDIRVRCPEGDSDSDGGVCSVTPFLFSGSLGSRSKECLEQLSEDVQDFYREHCPCNKFVEVRSGVNIANPLGRNDEKGVFSRCFIPAGTRICPYVGEVYERQPSSGKYIMEVSRDVFLDAEHDPYDVGYLFFMDPELSKGLKCPPNYGRYVNTIYPEDLDLKLYEYNCVFRGEESGLNIVWVVALLDIPPNVELLVDYGSSYPLPKKSRPRKKRFLNESFFS